MRNWVFVGLIIGGIYYGLKASCLFVLAIGYFVRECIEKLTETNTVKTRKSKTCKMTNNTESGTNDNITITITNNSDSATNDTVTITNNTESGANDNVKITSQDMSVVAGFNKGRRPIISGGINEMTQRQCRICGKWLPLDEYAYRPR